VISVLSLIVAALAVFVSPFVSWLISKRQGETLIRQIQSSFEIANRQITGPMRQAWINQLRDNVAELTSSALHYFVAGFGNDKPLKKYLRLSFLEHKIRLMLNPGEDDHQKLQASIRDMLRALERARESKDREGFLAAYNNVIDLSRQVFKREWNRVKGPIALPPG
jgi:hypothetical protein